MNRNMYTETSLKNCLIGLNSVVLWNKKGGESIGVATTTAAQNKLPWEDIASNSSVLWAITHIPCLKLWFGKFLKPLKGFQN